MPTLLKPRTNRRVRTISFSEINSYLSCQFKHDLSYSGTVLGATLKAKVAAPRLRDGIAWGAAVAAFHQFGDPMVAEKALVQSLDEDAAKMRKLGVFDQDEADLAYANLLAILRHYMAITPRMDGHSPEQKLLVPIPSRNGRSASSRFRLDCRLDLLATDHIGDWIIEFKLRDKLTPRALLEKSLQHKLYAWAWREATGRPVAGVVSEERLKRAPEEPKLVKARKMSDGQKAYKAECKSAGVEPDADRLDALADRTPSHDKQQFCTLDAYLEVCAEHEVAPEQTTIDALAARRWQQREILTYTEADLDEAGRELVSAAQQIAAAEKGDLYPLRNATVFSCAACDYRDICRDPHDREVVESNFDLRPPRAA